MQGTRLFQLGAIHRLAVLNAMLCVGVPSTSADTIAYWQFEPGNLTLQLHNAVPLRSTFGGLIREIDRGLCILAACPYFTIGAM